ncbi:MULTISPECIES: hypothetical protein [unclassified Bradyrhizobium]|uniref:hypothetical protein n=1 Tax=unclassified Bradyrhizobium TaxID=2631580 RepID=UPI002FEEF736
MNHRAFYLVICDRPEGPIIYETMVAQMDRATVRRHLRENQYPNPARVIEFVPAAGTCRDASHEFLNPPTEP